MYRRIRPLAIGLALLCLALTTSVLAQATNTYDAIQERGSIRLGVASSDPWYFKDPLSNEWDGLGVRLGQALADDLGVELETVETTYGNAAAALQADRIDIMFVLDATPERAEVADFIDAPLFTYSLAVLHDEELDASTWEGLNSPDINVGVVLGTSIDRTITAALPNANISRYPSNDEAVASFQSGRSDVVAMFAPALTMLQQRVGVGVIPLPEPVEPVPTSAGFRSEDDSQWRDFLNETLQEYNQSGKTQELYQAYLESRGIDPSTVPALGN